VKLGVGAGGATPSRQGVRGYKEKLLILCISYEIDCLKLSSI
jgi:hypothetical protein